MKGHNGDFRSLCLAVALLALCTVPACSAGEPKLDAALIARETSQDFGLVKRSSAQTRKTPIVVLEENHGSRAGQIEHAITLARLYERYGLRDVILEGYLKERPVISTEWFEQAARGLNPEAADRVAVRLLKEGEISEAEFLKLIHNDVVLHPAETQAEYPSMPEGSAANAPLFYLIKVAQTQLRQEHAPRLAQIEGDLERLKGDQEATNRKMKEYIEVILSADPWAQQRAKNLQDVNAVRGMSAEQQVASLEEIIDRAKSLSVEVTPEERDGMMAYLNFFRKRVAASQTMVAVAREVAGRAGVPAVAMIIGAAHTDGTCAALKAADRAFAVVTPLSWENRDERGDIPWDAFSLKQRQHSVYSAGYAELFNAAFAPSTRIKPQPTLPEPWLQAKAELYLYTERIATTVLSPPNPPPPKKPLFGFANDDFRGRWVFIDPNRISIIPDREDGSGSAVLFPAVLNHGDLAHRKEIWIKAGLGVALVRGREREKVESMLRKALEEVRSEKEFRKTFEDKAGRIQITLNTVAAFAPSAQAAGRVALGAI